MEFVQKRLTDAHTGAAGEENSEIKDKEIQHFAARSEKYARNALALHHDYNLLSGQQSRRITILEIERELSVEMELCFCTLQKKKKSGAAIC